MDEQNRNIENSNEQIDQIESQEAPAVKQKITATTESKTATKIAPQPTNEVHNHPISRVEQKSDKKIATIVLASISLAIVGVVAAILIILGSNGNMGNIVHTHTYEEWEIIKEATCTSTGTKERYCPCGEKQRSEISNLEHDYDNWTIIKEASCSSTGKKERKCECGDIQIVEIPKNDNHIEITISSVAATCTSTGLTEGKKCSVCGEITVAQTIISKTSHSLTETITKPATSTSSGTKSFNCRNCSYTSTSSYSAKALTSEEVYEIAEKSVGEITIYNKSGTAIALGTVFVYSSDGKLITNYHVIEGAYSAQVTLNNKKYTVSSVLAYDKNIDLAVLKINASNLYTPIIQTEGIKGGAKVYAVGSSEGYTLSFSTGVIASPSRTFDGVEYIQHEAAISHGNSGGPLFNEYGEVIGINTLTNIDGQNLNFAISCSELDNLSFGSSLTMKQFYEKECDVFKLIKNYIINNGTYSASNDWYVLTLETTYSSDYSNKYTRIAYYYVDENKITLDLHIDDGKYWVYFTITDDVDGSYDWYYFDDNDYQMRGTLYASTYDNDTLLGYSYNNISYSSLRSTVRELASSMVSILCSFIDSDFSDVGVTAEDLHFYNY